MLCLQYCITAMSKICSKRSHIYELHYYTSSARKILRCLLQFTAALCVSAEFSSALFRKTFHIQMVKAVVCDCPFEWAPFKSNVCMISMYIWQQKVNNLSSAATTTSKHYTQINISKFKSIFDGKSNTHFLLNMFVQSTIIVRSGSLDTWIYLRRLYPPRFYLPRFNPGRFYPCLLYTSPSPRD